MNAAGRTEDLRAAERWSGWRGANRGSGRPADVAVAVDRGLDVQGVARVLGVGHGAGDRLVGRVDEHLLAAGVAGGRRVDAGLVADLLGQRVLDLAHQDEVVVAVDTDVALVVGLLDRVRDRLAVELPGAVEGRARLQLDVGGAGDVGRRDADLLLG